MAPFAHAWLFDFSTLDNRAADHLLAQFSAQEIRRAATFTHAQRRLSFIASHALAYRALKTLFPDTANAWTIASEGQPLVLSSNADDTHLPRISLSHSGNFALCALTDSNSLIGCDIETDKPRVNMLAIARQFFTDSEYQLLDVTQNQQSIDAARQLFFRLWTCKEAWLKAQGLGIADGLKKISIDENGFTLQENNDTDWQLFYIRNDNHSMAIALKQNNAKAVAVEKLAWDTQRSEFIAIKSRAQAIPAINSICRTI